MFVLNAKITIKTADGNKVFQRVNMVEIENDSTKLEDRAMIKVPKTAFLERKDEFPTEVETAKQFKVGDEVVIELGYDGELREEFRGFVKQINPKIPLEIECEDEMYLLKRTHINASFKNIELGELLNFILNAVNDNFDLGGDDALQLLGEVPTIKFTKFYFRNTTAAGALEKLKDEYGLVVYFKNWRNLHVGLTSDSDNVIVKYRFGENVIDNNLEYENEEDKLLRIKAVLIKPDNTKEEKKAGDENGELRTLFFYGLDASNLKQRAEEEIKKYKYSGYKGNIKTFLLPNVEIGNVARLEDPNFEDRDGDYLVEKVTTTFGDGGARRKVELGIKLS